MKIEKLNKKMMSKVVNMFAITMALLLGMNIVYAAVLPTERADAMYHSYDGGGMKIDGPSILIRKSFLNKFSVSTNYYVDNVTSASIDVLANASAYIENRKEYSIGIDYLIHKTTISSSYTNSKENDYLANTAFLGISQDFFGDLSTVSIGYSKGWDTITRRGDDTFSEEADRQNYRLSWTQVVTKNMILDLGIDTITDQGYLNNPYRVVRYADPSSANGFSTQGEVYPETRTSNAIGLRAMYYLPYRASLKMEARTFSDTWDITAKNFEIAYIHPYAEHWIFEGKYRKYSQTQAAFYSDLFSRIDQQNYLARDKEMSDFTSTSYGFGVSYEKELRDFSFIKKFSVNLNLDFFEFDYHNFRNVLVHSDPDTAGQYAAGNEPFYNFDATVTRLFFTIYY